MSRDSMYDSVFKTMTQKMPHLLVPLVNYVFGTEFPEDVEVVRMGEEYEGKVKKRIADSVFRIEGRIFHIECQSHRDSNMAMRMDRHDREIAHEEAEARRECHRLKLPESCVIFLKECRVNAAFPFHRSRRARRRNLKVQDIIHLGAADTSGRDAREPALHPPSLLAHAL